MFVDRLEVPLEEATDERAPRRVRGYLQISLRTAAILLFIVGVALAPISARLAKHRDAIKIQDRASNQFHLTANVEDLDWLDSLLYYGGLQVAPQVRYATIIPSVDHLSAEDVQAVARLVTLTEITVDNTDIDDEGFKQLIAALPKIEKVFVGNTHVTKGAVESVRARRPGLRVIWY